MPEGQSPCCRRLASQLPGTTTVTWRLLGVLRVDALTRAQFFVLTGRNAEATFNR